MREAFAPLRIRFLGLALGVLLALVPVAVARAEDVPPTPAPATPASGAGPSASEAGAAARLTPEERAALERRFPEWDRLDAAARDRIANGALRLRRLSPEQRARVLDRSRRLDRAGPMAAETFARNLDEWARSAPDDRQRLLQADGMARALATEALARLPKEAREQVRSYEDGVTAGPWSRAALGLALVKAWRDRALASLVERPPLDHEPAAGSPRAGPMRELRERLRAAGGAQAPEDVRRRYAAAVLEDRVAAARLAVLRSMPPPPDRPGPTGPPAPGAPPAPMGPGGRALAAAYGRALRELDPAAFDAVVREFAEAAAKGTEGIEAFRDAHLPAKNAWRENLQWDLVGYLEARRRDLPEAARAKADELQATLLATLGVAAEKVTQFTAERDPQARQQLLREFRPRGKHSDRHVGPRRDGPPKPDGDRPGQRGPGGRR